MKYNIDDIDQTINKGIQFLAEHQFHHGQFCIYVGAKEDLNEWCFPESINFSTALIGTFLLPLKGNVLVDTMLKKAADFLRYQMMRGGTWNYFTNLHKLFPLCPVDVDDTVCISFFLKEMGYSFPDNIPLLLANRNKKGLFYTWFTLRFNTSKNSTYWKLLLRELKYPLKSLGFWRSFECSKNDIDGVVNANLLYYLGENEHTTPIIPFLLQIIEEHKEADCDKWYRDPFTFYYFLSRNYYRGISALRPAKESIRQRILGSVHSDGSMGFSVLDTALAVNTLFNFNIEIIEIEQAINYLIKMQDMTGLWARSALYYGSSSKKIGFGSEELTTALCLEALARYRESITKQKTNDKQLHEVY